MNHKIRITVEIDGAVHSIHELDNIDGSAKMKDVIRFWDWMKTVKQYFGQQSFADLFGEHHREVYHKVVRGTGS